MVLIEQEISERLSANSAVTGIVGTDIYPLPGDIDATKPYLTFQRVSTVPLRGLGGNENFATHRFQINCVGSTLMESKQLATAVRQALDSTVSGTVMDNELDRVDEASGVYVLQEYLIYRALDA